MDVTVIVIGFNGRHCIDRCLESLLDHDFSGEVEILYADNASTDGSADHVAGRFPSVRVLRFEKNFGFAKGNNEALAHAGGRFLVFVNQDVVVQRHCLAALVSALKGDARLGACQANLLMPWHPEFDPNERVALPSRVHFGDLGRFGFVVHRDAPRSGDAIETRFVSGACFAIDRRILADLGDLFDESFFMYAEDLDLSLRLTARGYELAVVPDAVAYHLHDETGAPGKGDVLRAYRATRNRIVAYSKSAPAFRRMLPMLVLGAPLKAFEIGNSRARQLLLFLVMIPITFAAAFAALIATRRYRRAA